MKHAAAEEIVPHEGIVPPDGEVPNNSIVPNNGVAQQKKKRLHLPFLDGLRGAAALYVVLFHVVVNGQSDLSSDTFLLNFFRFGHEAVVVFIVLSGFVLALPVARKSDLTLSGGLGNFFKRRGRRILPAYYPALFLMPLFFVAREVMKHFTGEGADWTFVREKYFSLDMLSHLFLVHNLSLEWVYSINTLLWSLATEWWIYFVFALLLVPVWRRRGVFSALALSIFLGMLPLVLMWLDLPSIYGSPHLLGAFGLGMVAAALFYSEEFAARAASWRVILIVGAGIALILFLLTSIYFPSIRQTEETWWITDFMVAFICAVFVLLTAWKVTYHVSESRSKSIATRFLESRPFVLLGAFSYSLYLTHLVVYQMIIITSNLEPVRRIVYIPMESMLVRITLVIPLLLLFAYGFYLLFEKPFLHKRK